MDINRDLIVNNSKRGVVLVLAGLGAFWLWGYFVSDELVGQVIRSLHFYAGENEITARLIFCLFAMMSVLLGPFTSSPIVPVAIVLWGNVETFSMLLMSWIGGSLISYAIGRFIGHPVVVKIMPAEKIKIWQNFISRRVNFYIAFLFRLAMPAETGYIFGLARYSFWKYAVITGLVEFLFALVVIGASDALISKDISSFIWGIGFAVAVVGTAAYLLKKKIKAREN